MELILLIVKNYIFLLILIYILGYGNFSKKCTNLILNQPVKILILWCLFFIISWYFSNDNIKYNDLLDG